jgi:DNA-binding NarL/FixJ family response regulator
MCRTKSTSRNWAGESEISEVRLNPGKLNVGRTDVMSSQIRRRALVVDDDRMLSALVKDVLVAAGFEVQLAHSAAAGSEGLADFDPDVAIFDIELGRGASGIDLAHLAQESYPETAVLLLSRYPDLRTAQASVRDLPPSCGFLSKSTVAESAVLLEAVESVLRDCAPDVGDQANACGPLAGLTATQLSVLRMVAQGFTTTEIARRRHCTTSAVEKILGTIYQKLNIDTDSAIHPRVEAIRIYASAAVLPERTD